MFISYFSTTFQLYWSVQWWMFACSVHDVLVSLLVLMFLSLILNGSLSVCTCTTVCFVRREYQLTSGKAKHSWFCCCFRVLFCLVVWLIGRPPYLLALVTNRGNFELVWNSSIFLSFFFFFFFLRGREGRGGVKILLWGRGVIQAFFFLSFFLRFFFLFIYSDDNRMACLFYDQQSRLKFPGLSVMANQWVRSGRRF